MLYSYYWICTDCNGDLIYGERLCYRLLLVLYTSLSLLLPFYLRDCFCYYSLCDYISILIIIVSIGVIITTIIIIFMTLLLLLHHCFIPFNTYYIHGNIIVNRSNNSMFLLRKSIAIGKSFISSTPPEFKGSLELLISRLLTQNVRFNISKYLLGCKP